MAFNNSGTKAVACDHPQKGVNYHLSYGVGKLSISEAYICSFSKIGQKIKKLHLFRFFTRKLRKISLN